LATKEDWDTSLQRTILGVLLVPAWGNDDERQVTFGIAVGGTSLICYALMTRLQNRRANRRSSGDSAGAGGGNYGGGDGWSISNWFGGDNSALDSSGNPIDSGGGGGDGDGGGGGGDGGSGGD
jgi:hypothetical protein